MRLAADVRGAVIDRLGVIGKHLAAHPSADALVTRDRTWTAAELIDEVAAASGWIRSVVGDERVEAVPAVLSTSADALVTVLAGGVAGVPVAPLNARSTPAELAPVVATLGSSVLLCDATTAALAREASGRDAVPRDVGSRGAACPPAVGRRDVFVLFHTSGTTGRPKPVAASADAIAERVTVYTNALGLGGGARYWTGAPFHHVAGLAMHLMALGSGSQLVLEGDYSSADPDLLRDLAPTHCMLVPTVVERWINNGLLARLGPAVLQYGGAPIDGRTLARVIGALGLTDLVQFFGQSEGSPITWLSPEDHRGIGGWNGNPNVVGRAIGRVELTLRNLTGDVGELGARGAHFFAPGPDGWLWTGDLVRITHGGWVELKGRLADRIVRGGENVYPVEIEDVIRSHPAVGDIAVVGVVDRELGEILKAVLVLREGRSRPTDDELTRHVRAELSGYKVPAVWEFVDALPYSAAGKVLRRGLTEPSLTGRKS